MPTIIDALVVSLSLDSKGLDNGATSAGRKLKDLEQQGARTQKGVKDLGSTAKESAGGMETLGAAVGKFLAVLGGAYALKTFVSSMVDSSAALDRLSKNLNLSAGSISQWSNAAEGLGGSAAGLQGSMKLLSKAQTDLQLTGASGLVPYLNYLGVSLADASGKAKPATDVLMALAGAAEKMDRQKAHNLLETMGFDDGTVNLLLLGRNELTLTLARQKEYGDQIAKFAPLASKFQHGLIDIKQQLTLLGLGILQQAAPALEKLLGYFESFVGWAQGHKQFITDLFFTISAGIATVGVALAIASDNPLVLIIAGVVALAAAFALLLDDYQTWKEGGKSLINWGQWSSEIEMAKKGMEELKKVAVAAFYAIATAAKVAGLAMHGDFAGANHALVAGTEKMNGAMGINAGPDETHDQNARKATEIVKKGAKWIKEAATSGTHAAGSEIPGKGISKEYMMQYFMGKGWSKEAAAGLAANGWSESSGVSTQYGDSGHAYGLFQWHKDRQDDFKRRYGIDIRQSTPEQQLDFKNFELTSGKEKRAGDHLRQAASAYQAGTIDSREDQRPGVTEADRAKDAAQRGSLAQLLAGTSGATSLIASAGRSHGSSTTNDNRVTNHVDSVVINAGQATDAAGIARAFQNGTNSLFVAPAMRGVS